MSRLFTALGIGVLSLVLSATLSTVALAGEKGTHKLPDVEEPGRTIHGKVVKVEERDRAAQQWDVSVENVQTGEVVRLHLDKTTERNKEATEPASGDLVVVKYDEKSQHALTFVKDIPTAP